MAVIRTGKWFGRRVNSAAFALACAVASLAPATLHAQQRNFENPSFEANDPQGPGNPSWALFPNAAVPGWASTTGQIELWDSNFLNVPANSGDVLAEMNATSSGALYQEVCMQNGETLSWTFHHRARNGGANPQIAIFEIASTAGTVLQTLATQNTNLNTGWQANTGTTTYTGPSGIQRVQFRTTNPGGTGNLLDDIQINLAVYVEFEADTADAEGGTTVPNMLVSGTLYAPVTVPFTVTGGTATAADYTLTATSITVPAGYYEKTPFPLPLSVTNDGVFEPVDETVTFTLGTPSAPTASIASTACGPAPKTEVTHTIQDDDPNFSASKTVAIYDAAPGDGQEVYALPGNDVIYTFTITNAGNGPSDIDSLRLIDRMPPEVTFYNGDIDDGGPETAPVSFAQDAGAGLSFTYANDVKFSDDTATPATFADCMYDPAAGYDPMITHICINPKGAFGNGPPAPSVTLKFRARID